METMTKMVKLSLCFRTAALNIILFFNAPFIGSYLI